MPAAAEDLRTLNRVRNSLLHFKPKLAEGLKGVAEIDSTQTMINLVKHGLRGAQPLIDGLRPLFEAEDKDRLMTSVERDLGAAEADVKAGRVYGPFSSAKAAIRSLHREAKKLKKRHLK